MSFGLQTKRINRLTSLCANYYFRNNPKGIRSTFFAEFNVEASKSTKDYEIQAAHREAKVLYNATWIDSFVDGRNGIFKPTGAIDCMIKRIGEADKRKKNERIKKRNKKNI